MYDRDVVLRRALYDIDGVGYPALMSVATPTIPKVPKRVYAAKRVHKPVVKKKEEVVKNTQAFEKKGSFSFMSGITIEPKNKDGIDLLTFNNIIILEAGDKIKMQCATGNVIKMTASVLQISRPTEVTTT